MLNTICATNVEGYDWEPTSGAHSNFIVCCHFGELRTRQEV